MPASPPRGPDPRRQALDLAEVLLHTPEGAFLRPLVPSDGEGPGIVVGEETLTITVLGTGAYKLKYPEGGVVAANPGQIRFAFVIDHGGTPTDPSEDEYVEDLGIIKESTGRNDDFCEGLVGALA